MSPSEVLAMCISRGNNMLIECRFGIPSTKSENRGGRVHSVITHFENILEAVARVRRLKFKMCLHFPESAWVMIFKVEETYVSAHMFFVKYLNFIHDPCCYLVFLSGPVLSALAIYFLFTDLCSAYEFFEARLIFVDNADISFVCKSFESSRSAANLYQTVCL